MIKCTENYNLWIFKHLNNLIYTTVGKIERILILTITAFIWSKISVSNIIFQF